MKLLSLLAGRTVGSCKEYSDKPAEMYSLINTLTAQKHHSLLLTLIPPKYYLESSVDQVQLVSEN